MAVVIHKDGKSFPVSTGRMFSTHGPWMLGQHRLDRLVEAVVIQDSSTATSHGTSVGTISTPMGGQLGRALAGALVAGPVGALIASGGSERTTQTATVMRESLNLNVFMRLTFKGEAAFTAQVTDEETFKLIMASVGQAEWTEERIHQADSAAKRAKASKERSKKLGIERRAVTYGFWSGVAVFVLFGLLLFFGIGVPSGASDNGGLGQYFTVLALLGLLPSSVVGYIAYRLTQRR